MVRYGHSISIQRITSMGSWSNFTILFESFGNVSNPQNINSINKLTWPCFHRIDLFTQFPFTSQRQHHSMRFIEQWWGQWNGLADDQLRQCDDLRIYVLFIHIVKFHAMHDIEFEKIISLSPSVFLSPLGHLNNIINEWMNMNLRIQCCSSCSFIWSDGIWYGSCRAVSPPISS